MSICGPIRRPLSSRAFNAKTGERLWGFQCSAGVNALPVSYAVDSKLRWLCHCRQLALELPSRRRGGSFRTGELIAYCVKSGVFFLGRLLWRAKERGT